MATNSVPWGPGLFVKLSFCRFYALSGVLTERKTAFGDLCRSNLAGFRQHLLGLQNVILLQFFLVTPELVPQKMIFCCFPRPTMVLNFCVKSLWMHDLVILLKAYFMLIIRSFDLDAHEGSYFLYFSVPPLTPLQCSILYRLFLTNKLVSAQPMISMIWF